MTSALAHAGSIYKCTQADGSIGFQSKPCANAEQETIKGGSDASQVSDGEVSLVGTWKIIEMSGKPVDESLGDDLWEFTEDEMTVISSGYRMRPDRYQATATAIVFDGYQIKIVELSASRMVVDTMGILQTLEKQ